MIQLYCGVGETRWNYEDVQPGGYACVSPVAGRSSRTKKETPVTIPDNNRVIQDSGAFSDNWSERLDFAEALERQQIHADKYHYADKIQYRASYDLLIDEVWDEGNRHKRRWSVAQAESAVETTVAAAKFIAENRDGLNLILSAQGVDAPQYLDCVEQVIPYMDMERDALGFGGWCIIGKMPKQMMPVFSETVRTVIPVAAAKGVKRLHIWGVIYPKALGELLWMCDQHDIAVSTDSSGVCLQPIFGQWGYGDWRDNSYSRQPVEKRGLERIRHLNQAREWLKTFRTRDYYREPKVSDVRQLALF
jgi:hypothetical protein